MKKLIIKFIYPLLDKLLPVTCATKIKIIGCVIVGQWRMQPFLVLDYNSVKSESEAHDFFADMDDESLEEIKRIYAETDLYITESRRSCFIYNWGAIEHPAGLPTKKETASARKTFCATNHLPNCSLHIQPASFFFHHGLKMLPTSVQAYLRDKDVIDAGAYWGDSTLVFREYSPRRIYAFEPSPESADVMAKVLARNKITEAEVKLEELGLGESNETMVLLEAGQLGVSTEPTDDNAVAMTTVVAYATQNRLQVGLIKADVEGMALPLIKGAVNTILRDRPVLSIAIYHNLEEFFGVYEHLRSLNANYRFLIRALSDSGLYEGETVLLAYPAELDSAEE